MHSQTFGEKLKKLRLNLGYTLKFVAEQLDYNPRALSEIEKNKRKISLDLIEKLANIYQVSHRDLMMKHLSEEVYYHLKSLDYAEEVLKNVSKRLKREGRGTTEEKRKDKIFASIKDYFSSKPIEKAYVFGSFAKQTNVSKDSDLDLLVVFKKPNKITLLDLIEMKEELSNKTGRSIDLVEEGQELDSIKNLIHQEKVLVYAS